MTERKERINTVFTKMFERVLEAQGQPSMEDKLYTDEELNQTLIKVVSDISKVKANTMSEEE
jgi:hypothetical protein|tara:strand:+ start:557 stop:742 length:186 start_codon:yes stop_codon:yes gene_type:complete